MDLEVDLTRYPLHIVHEAALLDSGGEEINVARLRPDRALIRSSGGEASVRRRLRQRLEALAAADRYITTTAPLRRLMMQSALSLSHGAEETTEALKGLLGLPAAEQGGDRRPALPVCPDILDELP